MLTVGIDTAEQQGLTFVGTDRTVKLSRTLDPRTASAALVPVLTEMLAALGRSVDRVECVVVGLGPGSYTGLRVGVSLAKALAWSGNLPLIGIPTLECLAATAGSSLPVCALLRGYRDRVYAAWYRGEETEVRRQSPYFFWSRDDLAQAVARRASQPVAVVSTAPAAEWLAAVCLPPNACPVTPRISREEMYLHLARRRLAAGSLDPPAAVNPIYFSSPVTA
jgi:tRNA threonylcarbamoyladenosine biosynthesis protein TsaB